MPGIALPSLEPNAYMKVDDYIYSPGGLFYAILQDDGDFCIYYGSDPQHRVGDKALWCASSAGLKPDKNKGPYYALIKDDGDFCIYYGSSPRDGENVLWCASSAGLKPDKNKGPFSGMLYNSGDFCVTRLAQGVLWCASQASEGKLLIDPISSVEVTEISYQLDRGTIAPTVLLALYTQSVTNTTATTQSTSISGSIPTRDTSVWYNEVFSVPDVKPESTFITNIPFVSNGKIITSNEIAVEFAWSGMVERSDKWSYNVPVVVPQNMGVLATLSVKLVEISVPFILKGIVNFLSLNKVNVQINGLYLGQSTDGLSVSFRPLSQQELAASEQQSLSTTAGASDFPSVDSSILPQITVNVV
jgi:hypothetical protein